MDHKKLGGIRNASYEHNQGMWEGFAKKSPTWRESFTNPAYMLVDAHMMYI